MAVQDISVQDVLRILHPIWESNTETASRLRGRIESVLYWATVSGHRAGDNPARWSENLKELFPAASKNAKQDNHPALTIDDAPPWFAKLHARDGMGSRALEFLVQTATRSGSVRTMTWDEVEFDKGLWAIPAAHMKMKRELRVPWPQAAIDLLRDLPEMGKRPA